MRHTPLLTILDESDGPRLSIVQICVECQVEVSRTEIDTAQIPIGAAGDLGDLTGMAAAEAWLRHVRRAVSVN